MDRTDRTPSSPRPVATKGFRLINHWIAGRSRLTVERYTRRISVAVASVGLWILLPISNSAQTSIVIRRTPQNIVVGADSKQVYYRVTEFPDGRREVFQDVTSKCKIRQADSTTFFAIAGQYAFDVDALAVESCKQGKSLLEKLDAFEVAVRGPLAKMLGEWRASNTDYFNRTRASREPVLQIVIFGLENGIPAYVTRDFTVAYQAPVVDPSRPPAFTDSLFILPVQLETHTDGCPLKHPPKESITHALGRAEAINQVRWEEQGRFWECFGDADGVRFLVLIETVAESAFVGRPIDILYIDAKSARWIDHKPECAEIERGPIPPAKSPIKRPRRRR